MPKSRRRLFKVQLFSFTAQRRKKCFSSVFLLLFGKLTGNTGLSELCCDYKVMILGLGLNLADGENRHFGNGEAGWGWGGTSK